MLKVTIQYNKLGFTLQNHFDFYAHKSHVSYDEVGVGNANKNAGVRAFR